MGISVLMSVCTHDRADYLLAALRSLVDQERPPDEVVLVEDGPLNAPLSRLVDEFRLALHIKSIHLPENVGLGAALSEGLKHCSHELVARMDSDDVSLPPRLERQAHQFDLYPNLDVLGSFAREFDEKSNLGALRSMPVTHEDIFENLWANPMIHSTVMFRRDRIVHVGSYDPRLRRRQDYELWFRCARDGLRFANLPETLALYRFSASTHGRQPTRLAFEQARIGHHGTALLGMAYWKRAACYIPFVRSLLPSWLQHWVYRTLRSFDPRQRTS